MNEPHLLIPLQQFVDSHLGKSHKDNCYFWDNKPISQDLAIEIFKLTNNKHTCYIQWADEMSPDLEMPLLWSFPAWSISSERWVRQKAHSESQRIERMVRDENVKMISKAYSAFTGVDGEAAKLTAYILYSKHKIEVLKVFGINKLITREDITE